MRAAVVCCGNLLMGDDGVGIAVGGALSGRLPEGVGLFVVESDPFALASIVENNDVVFVVDAVRAGGVPEGELLVRRLGGGMVLPADSHSFGLVDALGMVEPVVLQHRKILLLGIPVSDVVPRVGLSKKIEKLKGRIVADVCSAVDNYLNGNLVV